MKHESIVKAKENFIQACLKRRYHLIIGFEHRFAIADIFLNAFRIEGYDTFDPIKYWNEIKCLDFQPSNTYSHKNFYDVYIKILDDMIRVSKMGAFL